MRKALKPTIYIETTVVSAIVGRINPLPENARKQKFTRDWWKSVLLPHFTPVISTYVFEEASDGDNNLAIQRRKIISPFRLLLAREDIDELANQYLRITKIPEKARLDAFHIACATIYKIDYLVTWNCTHINNGFIRKKIDIFNRAHGIDMPIICTPEELTEVP
jgi:predicted nucleic acid-binding protein